MNNDELAIVYGYTGKWLFDNPVCKPNFWCSMCGERLYSSITVKFTIHRFNLKDLDFEYHEKCLLKALKGIHKKNDFCSTKTHLLKE